MEIKKVVPIVLLIFCLLAGLSLIYFKQTETSNIETQEEINEKIAEEYLIKASQQEKQLYNEDLNYEDNEIYGDFSEVNARGSIDCILEIPTLELRQSIFTGTVQQIEHDLKCWLPVTARADYKLGETHYCIYSHNPKNKSIRFSYAQELLKKGDYMIVTQGSVVYLYEVSNLFAEWRDKCTENYVDNMSIDSNMLYIFTCGRNEWQNKNVVVEGTLYDTYGLSDWEENNISYIEKFKREMKRKYVEQNKDALVMNVAVNANTILVNVVDKDGTQITDVTVGVFDEDGYLLAIDQNPIQYSGNEISISNLQPGTYYLGIYENNTEFDTPAEYKITIDSKQNIKDVADINEVSKDDKDYAKVSKIVALSLMCLSIVFWLGLILFKIIRKKKN